MVIYDYYYDYDETMWVWKMAAKVGLSLSYSPVKDLVFDTYIKAHIPAVSLMWFNDYDDLFLAVGGIGLATGLNIRYSFLMMGFEFNNSTMRFQNVNESGDYIEIRDEDGNYTDRIPLPTMNFTFGFSF